MSNEEYTEIKEQEKLLLQPTFLKRMLAGLIDLALFLVTFISLLLIAKSSLYGPLGYNDAATFCGKEYAKSGLYVKENDKYYSYLIRYNENLTPEENLEPHIVEFYTINERAKENDLLNKYYDNKLKSELFRINIYGECVRTVKADDVNVKNFLTEEYKKAVRFFLDDDEIARNQKIMYLTDIYTKLITATIASLIVYFLPCICSKGGETLGQRSLKLCLARRNLNTYPSKGRIALRSFVFILINIISPLLISIKISYLALIPIFLTIILMSFTKSQSSFHDALSKTYVVMKKALVDEINKGDNKKVYSVKHV